MDAKVLRAAVSAAIRVTISTTLIGCGGSVTSDANGPAPGGSAGEGTSPAQPTTPNKNSPRPSVTASGGATQSELPTSGSAGKPPTPPEMLAGTAAGGSTASAGAAGEGGEAGRAPLDPCSSIESCQNVLDADPELVSPMSQSCCGVVIEGLMNLQKPPFAACWGELSGRFLMSPAHQTCCSSENAWLEPACTPWGPPVPPELSEESALGGWESSA